MTLGSLHEALAITVGITGVYQLVFYAIAATLKFDKVTDLAGGSNFVVLSLFSFFYYNNPEDANHRQIALTALTSVWGSRLALFLFYRVVRFETDRRFDGMREDALAFLGFWVMQMLWVWLVSLPVVFINSSPLSSGALNWQDYIGFAMAVFGLVVEAIADQDKLFFKISNEGRRWCARGLWKYSRHPNYLGEIVFWWGIFISAARTFDSSPDGGYFTIVGPVFITSLLLLLSGMPILERNANKRFGDDPLYREYRECTSPLFLLPHSVYKNTPTILKTLFLFEWPLYAEGLTSDATSTLHSQI